MTNIHRKGILGGLIICTNCAHFIQGPREIGLSVFANVNKHHVPVREIEAGKSSECIENPENYGMVFSIPNRKVGLKKSRFFSRVKPV